MAFQSRLFQAVASFMPRHGIELSRLQACMPVADRLMQTSTAALDTSEGNKPRRFNFAREAAGAKEPTEEAATPSPAAAAAPGDASKDKPSSWAEVMKRVSGTRPDRRKISQILSAPPGEAPAKAATPQWLARVQADAQQGKAADAQQPEDDYSSLGTVGARRPDPAAAAAPVANQSEAARNLRNSLKRGTETGGSLNATFEYYAGATYVASDLNPYARMAALQARYSKKRKQQMNPRTTGTHPFSDREVRAYADYRNVHMLRMFVHDGSGALKGRDRRLFRAATHRKTARAIKTARSLALLPFVGKHPFFEAPESQRLRAMFDQHDSDVRQRNARAGVQ